MFLFNFVHVQEAKHGSLSPFGPLYVVSIQHNSSNTMNGTAAPTTHMMWRNRSNSKYSFAAQTPHMAQHLKLQKCSLSAHH